MSFETQLKSAYHSAHQRLLNPKPKKIVSLPTIPKPNPTKPLQRLFLQLSTEKEDPTPIWNAPKLRTLLELVSKTEEVDLINICSDRRAIKFARARQIFFYLAYFYTRQSLFQIGNAIGGRDHTTVLHGARKISHLILTNELWQTKIAKILDTLELNFRFEERGKNGTK